MIESRLHQWTVAIRLRCAPEAMGLRVPEAIGRIREKLTAAHVEAGGPTYTRYIKHDETAHLFELEVGIPVLGAVNLEGELIGSELPGGRVVLVWHEGQYSTLGASFAKLGQLVTDRGLTPAGPPWESYVVGPPSEPDSSRWRTALYQPIADDGQE